MAIALQLPFFLNTNFVKLIIVFVDIGSLINKIFKLVKEPRRKN